MLYFLEKLFFSFLYIETNTLSSNQKVNVHLLAVIHKSYKKTYTNTITSQRRSQVEYDKTFVLMLV